MFTRMFAMMMAALVIGAVAVSVGFVSAPCAMANEIVSLDRAFANPEGAVYGTTNALSRTDATKPLTLNVWGATPTNGTVTVKLLHTDGGGTVRTFSYTAQTLVAGVLSTNLATAAGFTIPYGVKFDTYAVLFSTATNGVFQLIGEVVR